MNKELPLTSEADNYFDRYDTKGRFCSYWHQLDEILSLKPSTLLEVGIGNKFIADYLQKRGVSLLTLDIERRLRPDVVGDVLAIPFKSGSFEVVCCFEVLEHLPYDKFSQAISELSRVSQRYVLLSLPDVTRHYCVLLTIRKIGLIKKLIHIPRLKPPEHIFDGEHYWEIGKRGYSLKRIKNDIERSGLVIRHSYRVFEYPYHRIFCLEKKT
ncbi:class I SAM-dependent methyltransferase [Candidatus Sumerlaeota bacterium]|nr:class I SAM-dependent methyltransferase [Candidatus Sumerlaeota bacterium]